MSTPMRWGAPPRGGGGGSYHVLGLSILRPVGWLLGTVVALSAFGSLLERLGVPVLRLTLLIVPEVWSGEVWRLVTWAPIELNPLNLLFGCLLLYYIGPDLVRRWGAWRFLGNYFGGAAVVGGLTCLVARFLWPEVALVPHMGLWPMQDAMIIAWASLFQDAQILMFFALPIAGRNLILLTVALTVVFGAMHGFAGFVPAFLAELLALVYMDVVPARSWILRARLAGFQRRYRRRTAKLTRIDRDEPPRWTH